MAGTSQAKTIPNPPGVTLKHLAKTQEEMRAQLKTLMLEQNEQTRELRAHRAEVEPSVQDDHGRRRRSHVRDDPELDNNVESDNGDDHRGRGQGPRSQWVGDEER